MLALISPAKKLDFEQPPAVDIAKSVTQPDFQAQSKTLVETLRAMSEKKLQKLMGLSDALAELNYGRYQNYKTPFTMKNAQPAIYAFRGDTYQGLDADTLGKRDLNYAQKHLRMLSGLYGLLRPLDLIQPYRLEMGTNLKTKAGKNLYEFWDEQLTQACNEVVATHKDPTVVCLASNEYIKVIRKKALNSKLLTCQFKEMKNGKPTTIGFFAKRARGMMARYMIVNRVEQAEGLKGFGEDGYTFSEKLSDEKQFVFVRKSA